MSKTRRTIFSIVLAIIAGGLLVTSLRLPLWQMRMEAPQYRDEEALTAVVYPNALRGDIKELETLNQYIGVTVPERLPQFDWLPKALIAAGVAGLAAAFLPRKLRKWTFIAVPTALSIALLLAAVQARQQMHDIGHNRDAKAPLRGVKDFTPPLLGKTKLFQFEVESWFGAGAFLIAGAIALQLGAAFVNHKSKKACGCGCQSSSDAPPLNADGALV